jgi:ubiquinone/menaquinone biosynthesis C-methylase UbiE
MDIELYRNYSNALEKRRERGWRYNEMKPCGVKYNSVFCALSYDVHHQRFRDYKRESDEIIATLGLNASQTVVDMGCGTGAFAINAARHCRKVFAVDVSKAMLGCARRKAKRAGLDNIEFGHGGFLTYEHQQEPVDAIVSTVVLHHLPNFWKLIGLQRMAQMLKPEGKLFLFDVVFSFDVNDYKDRLDNWIKSTAEKAGLTFAMEAQTHVHEEYSTFDWIMEGLLEQAGFVIDKAEDKDEFIAAYLCTKKG